MLDSLFSPLKIGTVEIKNRAAVTAMVMNFCDSDGFLREQFIRYHEEKAKGGFGLIITEDYAVGPHYKGVSRIAGLFRDEQIEANKRLTSIVHSYGTKIFCQIYHPGRQSYSAINGGAVPEAASPIACPLCKQMPRELTREDLKKIVEMFGETALRAKQAGFDGVEIHGGNGYLVAGFLSPYQNHRTDEYGGCLMNRLRLITEIYHAVREKVGREFPLSIRFSADEDVPGGRTLTESRVIARYFEKLGFDMINCSNGTYSTHNLAQSATSYQPFGVTLENARQIKEVVNIPVLAVNRIKDPVIADAYIEMGWCDLCGLSRASLADPHLPEKAMQGKHAEIRPCIGCKRCEEEIGLTKDCRCTVNPMLGREYLYSFEEKTADPKTVVVIGGGPAGVQAAVTAARRGHRVSLYEKNDRLGGKALAAGYPPGKSELAAYCNYLNTVVPQYDIDLHLNCTADASLIRERNPDVVILAAGGVPVVPPVKGAYGENVFPAEDVLLGKAGVSGRIVVAGGGDIGLETANYLAYQERGDVTVIEMTDKIAAGMNKYIRSNALRLAESRHVQFMTGTKIVEFAGDHIVAETDGGEVIIPCDAVVVAMGYRPDERIREEFAFLGEKLMVIGDADQCRDIMSANEAGLTAGFSI